MASIQALRECRNALAQNLQTLVDSDKTPEWKPEHQAQYDTAMAEVGAIDDQIKRHDAALAKIAENALDGNVQAFADDFVKTPGAHKGDNKALRAFLTGGVRAMTPEDITVQQQRQTPDIRAAMSTTTNGEGGYTVATEYYRQLTEAMKLTGGIRAVASTLQTSTGAQMNFPAADATSEVGEIVGQNAAVTAGDTTFSNLTMDVYKYSSKKIALPFELIQDSMFDIEGYIQALLATRIGRITGQHFTTGSGTGQPKGLITAATVGKTAATGGATTVSYDDLVDLEHSVDPVYRAGLRVGYMMHDSTVKALRKLKDTQGRPIFVPGYEQGNPGGAPDRLLGRPIYINQDVAAMAANAVSIAFGDFSKYLIREVMDLTLFRMADSGFLLSGQIGFVAFNRQGGNLIDVGGAVKTFKNSAS